MSVHPGNEVLMRMSAVERVVYGDATLEEVARKTGVPLDDLSEWVRQEVAELEGRLNTAKRALTKRVNGKVDENHTDNAANDDTNNRVERPWIVNEGSAAPSGAAEDDTLRRQVSDALNAADTVLCVSSGEQIHEALRHAREAGHVRGVVLILEPRPADADTSCRYAHGSDDTAEVNHPADDTHDAEESDAAVTTTPEARAGKEADSEIATPDDASSGASGEPTPLSPINGSRRAHAFPTPQPKPIVPRDKTHRPNDPTELDVYRPEVDDALPGADQSDEYAVLGADETDPPGHDKVFRLDLGEHGDYADATPGEQSDAGERSDGTELPGVQVDATLVLKYRCEYCGRKLKSKGSTLGQKVRCKGCNEKIVAPRSWTDPRVYYSSRDSDPNSDSGGGSTV